MMRNEYEANRAMVHRAHGPYAPRIGATFHQPAPVRHVRPRGFVAILRRIIKGI